MLQHVSCEISLLRVRLATDLTDLRLDVLGFAVFRDVLAETSLVGVALVAGVAAVRLVGHVTAGVRLQIGELGERLPAARVVALVRLLSWRTKKQENYM